MSRPEEKHTADVIDSWGQFRAADAEARFHEHMRRQDQRSAYVALAAGIFAALVFITTDFQILSRETFRVILAARIAFTLLSVAATLFVRRDPTPVALTRVAFSVLLCGAALMAATGWTRSSAYFIGQVLLVNFILLLVYLVVPLSLRLQLTAALLFTANDIFLLTTRHMDMNPIVLRAIFLTYALTNVMGAITSQSLHCLKREQFANLQRESGLRANLEKAMAEVKTLEGLLSICSYCRKIKTEDGSWEPLDQYISNRSAARFSHGICPECLEPLMREIRGGVFP